MFHLSNEMIHINGCIEHSNFIILKLYILKIWSCIWQRGWNGDFFIKIKQFHDLSCIESREILSLQTGFRCACMHAKSLQLCLTLCDPVDCSLPGSSVHGILRQEYWIGLPFPSSMHESEKGKWSHSGCNLKNNRMISVRFQGKLFNIMVIQVYAPTSNAEEAEVECYYKTF